MHVMKFDHLIIIMTLLALIVSLSHETVQASRYLLIFEINETTNTPPVASNDTYTTNEDTILNVSAPGVLNNDSDADNDPISAYIVSLPEQGYLTLNSDGSFIYSPNSNYNGSDSFTYVANDGNADSNMAVVTITVTPVNDPPVANSQEVTVSEDSSIGISLTALDVDGDSLTFSIVTQPTHGVLSGVLPNPIYTPNLNYHGLDSFTFKANDGLVDSNIATVNITVTGVNDAPVAVNDNYSMNEDTILNIPAPGVLSNDYDIDGDILNVQLVNSVSHGALSLNTNGGFTYTPTANYFGTDSFTYRAYDGQLYSNGAVVTITVNNLNDPPVAIDDFYTVAEDTLLNILAPGVLSNDTDPEGGLLSASKVSGPTHGSLTLNSNGGFTYLPASNYHGVDSFTYVANDGQANSNVATVSITVTPVNDAPVALNDTYSVNEDAVLSVATPGVLTNDQDVDGDPLSVLLVNSVGHGTLTLNINGSFTYTPSTDYFGSDSFTYRAYDGKDYSNLATVTLTVNPINDAPVAMNDSGYRANILGINVAAPGVLVNDSDKDGDLLVARLGSGPLHGVLTLNNNGGFVYIPNANYRGTDSFTYRAYDGKAYSADATVTIEVDSVRPLPPDWVLPVGNNGTYLMREDTAILEVTTFDTDINYVRFQWWNPEGGDGGEGAYEILGEDTESPFSITLSFSRLPVNQLSQVFAEVWDDFGNVSLNTLNNDTYSQTVRRIFIFPTTFRNQIFLPLIFK